MITIGPIQLPRNCAICCFFGVAPTYGGNPDSYYQYLIAQPTWLPAVGLDFFTTPAREAIRKLSIGNWPSNNYARFATGLGAGR